MQPEQDPGTTLHVDTRVSAIDRQARKVTTHNGETFGYGQLLLATGCEPIRLDLAESERVRYFRSVDDYDHLRRLAGENRHIAVVGGSYIGSELAAALIQNDCRVTLICPEPVLGGGMLPPEVADRLHQTYLDHGVALLSGRKVKAGREADGTVTLELDDGSELAADGVMFGLGSSPAPNWRRRPDSRSTAVSWSTSGCAPPTPRSTPPAMSPPTPTASSGAGTPSTLTTPTVRALRSGASWPAATRPTPTPPTSTPTSSISPGRRWGGSTARSTSSPTATLTKGSTI
nr:NAD(P)/FAD-dependent oxidoreductase [Salinicola tamaricis]